MTSTQNSDAGTRTDMASDTTMVGVADYPHRRAGHCGSGALRDLLEWASLSWSDSPLDEGTVFGLGGELAFSYLRGPGLGAPFYLVGRGPDLTGKLARRLGIDLTVRSTDDPDQGRDWLRHELDAGRPLLCWADMRELPYLRVRMHMSRHDIVVTGYDPATEHVRVVDNDRDDPQLIPAARLAVARASTGFPEPTRHTCYPMRFPAALPDQRATGLAAAAATAQALRAGTPVAAHPDALSASGIAGVATFADDLAHWPELFPEDGPPGADLHTALVILAVFVEKAGTGGALFRRLQADFLTGLADVEPAAAPAAAAYRDLAAHWTHVAASAAGSGGDESVEQRWEVVAELVRELPRLERNACVELENLEHAR